MFLNFSPLGFFMGTIMTFYIVAFSYFFHRVSRVFAQIFVIYIFRFFPLIFLNIHSFYVIFKCSRMSVTKHITVWSLDSSTRNRRTGMTDRLALLPNHRAPSPSHPSERPPRMYKRKGSEWIRWTWLSQHIVSQFFFLRNIVQTQILIHARTLYPYEHIWKIEPAWSWDSRNRSPRVSRCWRGRRIPLKE
jgi:hypothetical protein